MGMDSEVLTLIRCRGKLEVARTRFLVPLNHDGSVDYNEYIQRITRRRPERDLTKVF
jgi:hypothetical protein